MFFTEQKKGAPDRLSTIGRTRIFINRCGCGRKFSDKKTYYFFVRTGPKGRKKRPNKTPARVVFFSVRAVRRASLR